MRNEADAPFQRTGRGSKVVMHGSAKAVFGSSILPRAFFKKRSFFKKGIASSIVFALCLRHNRSFENGRNQAWFRKVVYARVAKLADATDLKSVGDSNTHAGSIPAPGMLRLIKPYPLIKGLCNFLLENCSWNFASRKIPKWVRN